MLSDGREKYDISFTVYVYVEVVPRAKWSQGRASDQISLSVLLLSLSPRDGTFIYELALRNSLSDVSLDDYYRLLGQTSRLDPASRYVL